MHHGTPGAPKVHGIASLDNVGKDFVDQHSSSFIRVRVTQTIDTCGARLYEHQGGAIPLQGTVRLRSVGGDFEYRNAQIVDLRESGGSKAHLAVFNRRQKRWC